MIKNISEISESEKKEIFYTLVSPRPIAWIVTESKSGVVNIAPFSFYNLISTKPVTLMVAIGNKLDGTPKDTLRNIRETGKATICNVIPADLEKMEKSGESLSENESEAEKFGIDTEKTFNDFPPRITNSTSSIFCTFAGEMEGLQSKTIPIFLIGKKLHLGDEVSEIQQIATTKNGYGEC
jgi:flavin reductase (DIM6/NTAB) family NADH-FMN oxidoreductase RutF